MSQSLHCRMWFLVWFYVWITHMIWVRLKGPFGVSIWCITWNGLLRSESISVCCAFMTTVGYKQYYESIFTRPGQGWALRRCSNMFLNPTKTTATPATNTANRQQGPARVQWRYPHWNPFSYCTLECRHAPWDASPYHFASFKTPVPIRSYIPKHLALW